MQINKSKKSSKTSKKNSKTGGLNRKLSRKDSKKDTNKLKEPKKSNNAIILKYLSELKEKLEGSGMDDFGVFSHKPFSEKMYEGFPKIQKYVKEHAEDYAGQYFVPVLVNVYLPNDDLQFEYQKHRRIYVSIDPSPIDSKGKIQKEYGCGISFYWKESDFAKAKFSFKLIKYLIPKIIKYKLNRSSLMGMTLDELVLYLSKYKIDISKYLEPLPDLQLKKSKSD